MEKHSGETGKVKKVTLTSSIEQVLWTKISAAPGGKVGLEIITQLVGSNSDVSIQISDKSGKTYNTIKKKIFGNKSYVEVIVPEKAKDELFAEIKLSKLSLTKKSNALNLFPPIEIKNLKWDKDELYRGDIVKISADVTGVYNGAEAEIQIWEHDSDGAHDLIAKFPCTVKNYKVEVKWEFQYSGNTESIPTSDESEDGYQQPKYFFRINVGEIYNDSGLLKFKDWIEIKLTDSEGYPVKDIDYELQLPDGEIKKGKLDNDGYAKVEYLPPGKYKVSFPYKKDSIPEYKPPEKDYYTYD